MFFCVLRAVKGEYGEVGKSLRVRWLLVTVISWLFLLQRLGRVGAHQAEGLDDYRGHSDY